MGKYLPLLTVILHLQFSLTSQNTREVYSDKENNQLYFEISVDQGMTVYSISKNFRVDPTEIVRINHLSNSNALDLRQRLIIPVNISFLTGEKPPRDNWTLQYIIKEKETLYHIAKRYLNKNVSYLTGMNKISGENLHPGDTLTLGYFMVGDNYSTATPIALSQHKSASSNIVLPSSDTTSLVLSSDSLRNINEILVTTSHKRGIATWDSTDTESYEFLAMHPSARINSQIEIFNPMLNRRVKATVVGHLPQNLYPEDISIVISRPVAHALGALDRKFFVEMTYVE